MKSLLSLLVLPVIFPLFWGAQKPSQGKVLVHVSAGESSVYKELQQRAADLESSARDIRRHLGKAKWIEVTDDADKADICLVVLGRRRDPDKGNALGYSLDAGAYKTEDEFIDLTEEDDAFSGRARDVRSTSDESANKRKASWEDLAETFAQSLDGFAQANYDRIVGQRQQ